MENFRNRNVTFCCQLFSSKLFTFKNLYLLKNKSKSDDRLDEGKTETYANEVEIVR